MAITKVKDPISGKEITLAKGSVSGVYFNELKETKDYGTNGKSWIPTHVVKVKIDNEYISLGLTDKDKVGVKDADDKWHDLAKGMVVTAVVTVDKANVKGKEYINYNSRANLVTVNDFSKAEAAYVPPAKGEALAQPYKAKDFSGVECGHSLNGALALSKNKMKSTEDFLELAKFVHQVTANVKKIHGETTGKGLDAYSVGASAGQAVIASCNLLSVEKKDKLEETAVKFLLNISTPLLDFIKNGDKPEPKEEIVEESANSDSDNSFEEDIPF